MNTSADNSLVTLIDRVYAHGNAYAESVIAGGQRTPLDNPLSGEWADEMTPARVFSELEVPEEDRDDLVLTFWEDGYTEHEGWPEPFEVDEPHEGHRVPITGAWHCDTCDSPYCERA